MKKQCVMASILWALLLASCSGGSPTNSDVGTDSGNNCSDGCAASANVLMAVDVRQIIAQAAQESQAQGVEATVAVVDRVGNVLALYRMGDVANREGLISTTEGISGDTPVTAGWQGIRLPVAPIAENLDGLAAIVEAVIDARLRREN